MALTAERRALLLAYCQLDEEDLSEADKILLEREYVRAVDYLAGAGVSMPTDPGRLARYDSLVDAMVLDRWDNRGTQTAGYTLTANPAFRHDLNQLKLTEPVSDSGTGTGSGREGGR